ncbi:hypothetical protein AB4059_05170 [Lysobacter sp. 2RAF19]
MKSKEFLDLNLRDLRESMPHLLANSTGARHFIGIFGGVAGAIVNAAREFGPDAEIYATYNVGKMLVDFAAECEAQRAAADPPTIIVDPYERGGEDFERPLDRLVRRKKEMERVEKSSS